MTGAVVAVDIGGTTVKASVVDELGFRRHHRTGPSRGGDDTVAVVLSLITSLREAAVADGLDVLAVGVVTPGLVDAATGTVAYASNLGWRDFDLRSALAGPLGVPVSVGHDVRAAGRAERHLGAARGADDFVLLQLGTGIAAAVVTEGTLVSGAGSAAGEAGHMPVYPDGEPCPCGKRGCLEAYAAGAAVPRRYHEALAAASRQASPPLTAREAHPAAVPGGAVHSARAAAGAHGSGGPVGAARSGTFPTAPGAGGLADAAARVGTAADVVRLLGVDPVADRVWGEAVRALGFGVSTLTMLLDPALVVLGGGMAQAGDALLVPVRRTLTELLVWREAPELRLSTLGPAAGQWGAAIEAFALTPSAACVATWTSPTPAIA
ncbi:ROK family protein [Cryptosporangium sp. NPDC048952]|uniref:ROK family protein n=1 Tax=Cryptosporangium sp. NPDC048952 TaxID=3363961 RepID=UPI00371CBA42